MCLMICWYFFSAHNSAAFLWEDLGLDLYKTIDEGFYELERQQYEHELTGQWETSVEEVVRQITQEAGLDCEITSLDEMENILWNGTTDQIPFILQACAWETETISNAVVERVINTVGQIKNDYSERATDKVNDIYDIAKIWIFSDGNIENSSFDLIHDLQEIDRIIFSEEIPYEWVPYEESVDEALEEFLEENNEVSTEDDDEILPEEVIEDDEGSLDEEITPLFPELFDDIIDDHSYVCAPDSATSGLNEDEILDIVNDIEWNPRSGVNPFVSVYEWGIATNGASWWGPFATSGPAWWSYIDVRDEWNCDWFFCITIEFIRSNYGLTWWNTQAIETILKKAAGHLEKPANTSLTQRKMTTNNFEMSSIIKDLPWMLRGFGIEVQTKPIPILDVESENEDVAEWDQFELDNLLASYYTNLWLDYERRNDLDVYWDIEEETQVLQNAGWQSITFAEDQVNELRRLRNEMRSSNRQLSLEVEKEILRSDLRDFWDQFTELERFVWAIEDFVEAVSWSIWQMNKIPVRSS